MAVKRTVNMVLVEKWRRENNPHAAEKLAIGAKICTKTAAKLFSGGALGNTRSRCSVAEVLGTTEDELFPVVKKRA